VTGTKLGTVPATVTPVRPAGTAAARPGVAAAPVTASPILVVVRAVSSWPLLLPPLNCSTYAAIAA